MPFISKIELDELNRKLTYYKLVVKNQSDDINRHFNSVKTAERHAYDLAVNVIEAFDLEESYNYKEAVESWREHALPKYDVDKFVDDVQDVAIEKRQAIIKVRTDMETKQRNVRLGLKKEGK